MSSIRRRSPYEHHHGPSDKIKSNMRMDRKPNATRISDPSHPAGKRKEIDNVMKKARQQPANEYWNKKLLETEEKDPNRWKHTGYKKMYVNGRRSSSEDRFRYRSRSPVRPVRKVPISPRAMRHQSPIPVRRRFSKTPERRPRSPGPRFARRPSPHVAPHEMKGKEIYRSGKRPVSPPPKLRSPSMSSCSDDSCSVCSSDDGRRMVSSKTRMTERHHGPANRMRPERISPERVAKKNKLKEISPKRRHQKRPVSPPPEKTRRLEPSVTSPVKKVKDKSDKLRTRVKVEGEKRRNRSPSTASDDSTSSEGSFTALTATTRMTLSERFGKMAQWNNDRKYDMGNMKITKNSEGGEMKVMIQEGARQSPVRPRYSPAPEGHYPEELLAHASAQAMGLSAWDDVRVRFDYYKSKGYLRDLTLQDYIKWEEWWYRYQEWLKQERYFEMWERNMQRRRRKKMPITQRLN